MKSRSLITISVVATCVACSAVDLNNSGLSDVFEFIYFGAPADPLADPDGDGASNYEEMVWGTNPTNATSKVSGLTATLNGSELILGWPAPRQRIFQLQVSADLQNWQAITNVLTIPYREHLTGVGIPPHRFYRLRITLNPDDSDGDGLADWEDLLWLSTFGQSPSLTDTDGDGLPNAQEFQQGRNLAKKDHPAVGLVLFTPLGK